MAAQIVKPRLVFFKFRYPASAMPFQLLHREEHVRCLAQDFDVACVDYDCDYAEVCDRLAPELCVFESGLEVAGVRRIRISNVKHDDSVPKIALLNSDGCSELRSSILCDVDHWGISTLFSISLVAAEHLREIANRLFVLPNFIDPEIFRDYRQEKDVPALLTGSLSARYPWRNEVCRLLLGRLPIVWSPHPGYINSGKAGSALIGETYARLLNRSKVTLACGSVTNELVRKHLEIPASMSCLVAERSPALEVAGFVDMVNCVFASPAEAADKIAYLLNHEQERASISRAGSALVEDRHTIRARRQIFQWYDLNRRRGPWQTITQPDLFGPLQLVEVSRGVKGLPFSSAGRHLRDVDEGFAHLEAGREKQARSCFARSLSVLCELPEAKYGMALAELYSGRPRDALRWIRQPLQTSLVRYGADDPDPAEWALLIIALICLGKSRAAVRRADQFHGLRHIELDRARWAVGRIVGRVGDDTPCPEACDQMRPTVHRIPRRDAREWSEWLARLLEICGRTNATRRLRPQRQGLTERALRPVAWSIGKGRARPTLSGLDHPDLLVEIGKRAAESTARALRFGRQRVARNSRVPLGVVDAISRVFAYTQVKSVLVAGEGADLRAMGRWEDRGRLASGLSFYAELPLEATHGSSELRRFGFEAIVIVGTGVWSDESLGEIVRRTATQARVLIFVAGDDAAFDANTLFGDSGQGWIQSCRSAYHGGAVTVFKRQICAAEPRVSSGV